MEINYPIIGLVILALLILIFLMVRKNRKDAKQFEKDMNRAELDPEKHTDNENRI